MPHASVKFLPGVDQNDTPALNEAGLSYTNLIRFVPDRAGKGLVQKLGGWTGYPASNTPAQNSIVRALWAWEDTNNQSWLALGAESNTPVTVQVTSVTIGQKYIIASLGSTTQLQWNNIAGTSGVTYYVGSYISVVAVGVGTGTVTTVTSSILSVINSGTQQSITPQTFTDNVSLSVNTTVGSSIVTINDTGPTGSGSNISSFDSVFVPIQISVGGQLIFGLYQCTGFDANNYFITAVDTLGNPSPSLFTTNTATTVGASGTGTVATLTFTSTYVYPVDSWITVSGVTPSGYNGTYKVTTSSAGSVSYLNTTTGSQTVAGTIRNDGFLPYYTATNGSPFINVTLPLHGYSVGQVFPVLIPVTVGGITIQAANYVVTSVTMDTLTFTAYNTPSASGSTYPNGGLAQYQYYVGFGSIPTAAGYGSGGYGLGGYGVGTAVTPSTGAPITATDWTFDNFGQVLVACPVGGPLYAWDPTTGSPTATIIPNSPTVNNGAFVAMPQRQIVAWGSTFNGIQDPLLIRWSDVENAVSWIGTAINQAGSYRIPKGSKIVGAIQGPQQGLVWTDVAVWSMQYTGQPYIYSFNEVGTGCGLIAPKAASSHRNVVYWMGASQFYMLSGNGVEPLQCPIWDVVYQNLDRNNVNKIRIAVNSYFSEVSWYYPSLNGGGEVDSYVKYNTLLGQWDFGSLSRTAWINQSVLGAPIGASSDKKIYQHETSTDAAGQAMPSFFQTGYFAMNEGDMKTFIDQVWPDMKWGYYNGEVSGGAVYQSPTATVQLYFYTVDYPGDTPVAYGPFTLTQATQFVTPRFRARLVSIAIYNPTDSSGVGTFWRIGNMRYRYQPDGKY